VGELILQNGFINGTAIETAQGRFNYADARFNALSSLIVEGPEPVTLQASIPYSLPFMAVEPDSDRILIEANVRDEGLSLLNVLNRQVAWESGEGEVQLRVTGTLSNPLAQGIARLNGATLQAQILPEPLTDVTGEVRFNRDRIIVDGLQGQFSQGEVVAQGVIPLVLPLSGSDPDRDTPLTVALDNIELNLKGIYSGDVDGQVSVTGSALAPELGGNIVLSDGRVSLPEGAEEGGTTPVANPDDTGTPVQFDNLTLVLGNNVQVTREPILAFLAEGDLTLNGTLDDIRPRGVIELQRGQVNLFTTRFRLARGYPQVAVFRPDRGLDPILDVRLVTNVTEVSRAPIPSLAPLSSSEIQDVPPSAVGELQTVRIAASVQGPASELFNNLELTSSPSRSETEIIALIGGGFVDTLGRGDSTLALANLAGSTLLGNIQALIGDAVGLSEFRLFPTYTTIDEDGTTALGIGAELGIDVTEDVSVSVLQMLTESTQPTRFNVRYRLNDEFLLRGSTNLSGRDSMVLEYQTRF
jgi:translocation and assembly module TamB